MKRLIVELPGSTNQFMLLDPTPENFTLAARLMNEKIYSATNRYDPKSARYVEEPECSVRFTIDDAILQTEEESIAELKKRADEANSARWKTQAEVNKLQADLKASELAREELLKAAASKCGFTVPSPDTGI